LVYIDEVGINDNIVVQYGWSEKGSKSYAEQSGFRSERVSIIAGYDYSNKQLVAPFEFKGHLNADLFYGWFEQVLCPVLVPGSIIIMDNASFHKSDEIKELAKVHGCELIFLPPYSPDLNPIEKFWAWFKARIRKLIHNFSTLAQAIDHVFSM
jgi:transposase